jgi:4-amino-4-deoxychorismate lyase
MAPGFQLFSSLRYDPLLTPLAINTESWDGPIKTGSPFYLLPYHRDRILQAAEHFGWTEAAARIRGADGLAHFLSKLTEVIDVSSAKPVRIRALLDHEGKFTIEMTPIYFSVSESTLFPRRLPPPRSENKVKVSPLTGGALTLGDHETVHGDPEREEPWIVVPDSATTTPSEETLYKTTSRGMYTRARERAGIKGFDEKKEVLIVSDRDGEIMEGSLTSVFFWRNGKWTTPPVSSGGQIGTTRRWALEKGLCVEAVVKADSLVDGEECYISNGVRGFNWAKVRLP